VIRSGVALTLSVNVPFRKVASAELKPLGGGRGDISLKIGGGDKFSYVLLWPNIRPWRIGRPEPTMRSVPDAQNVAAMLTDALRAFEAEEGMDFGKTPSAATAPQPARRAAGPAVPAE
jgi:hypothetical protein